MLPSQSPLANPSKRLKRLNLRPAGPRGNGLERLESRVFLHGGGFEAGINFQKATPAAPAGYFLDAGHVFGDRGNGLAYGWDADNTASARDRNNSLSPDQRYDTLTHMQLYGARTWEVAVPNGSYTVHVVGGDPSAADATLGINVEGTLALSGKTSSTQRWREGTVTVQVSDGRLTVSNAAGAVNNKINFIDIHAADTVNLPTVGVSVSDGAAGEAGPNPGSFLVTRTGDTTDSLAVNYRLSGTATNGADYETLSGSVLIPAGAASALVTVNPADDSIVEGAEGVTLSLLAAADYDLSGTSSATLQIVDNDTGGGTGFSAKVNFQPAGTAVPAGYVADTGLVFGDRGNALSYGWNLSNSSYARDRNSSLSPDQRYDTLNQMQRGGGGTVWEMAVPNGTYTVHVVAGDPSAYDSTYAISVEGVLAVSGKPTSTVKWFEGTKTVTVTDGRLTVTNAAGSANNKIAFIDVFSDGAPVQPQVTITAPDASASEGGDPATFVVTRTGPTDQPLLVRLTRGGSATNGVDYDTLGDDVTIPAGAASATFNVRPIQDSLVEGSETVAYAIAPGTGYAVGSTAPVGVTIRDDDSAGTTLAWGEVAPVSVGRSEAMGAVVNGKLYVFGGYVDTTFTPTRRADAYDPATNTWRQIANLPSFAYAFGGASHVGTAALGSSIYFAGGYPAKSPSGQTFATSAVFRYDTLTDTYASLPSLPSGRGGGALVALGRELHFFGGADAARADSGSHWALNLDDVSAGWVARASLPVATNHVAGVVLGGKIYSIGGQQFQDDAAIQRAEVQAYDPATDRWTARAPLPIARSHITSSTFVRGGKILVLGGLKQGNVVMNTVTSYDPTANAWTSLTPLPSARLSGVSDVLPDGRIVFATGAGNGFRDTTWVGDFV